MTMTVTMTVTLCSTVFKREERHGRTSDTTGYRSFFLSPSMSHRLNAPRSRSLTRIVRSLPYDCFARSRSLSPAFAFSFFMSRLPPLTLAAFTRRVDH